MAYPGNQINAINRTMLRQKLGAAAQMRLRGINCYEGFKRQQSKIGKVSEMSCSWQCEGREEMKDVVLA